MSDYSKTTNFATKDALTSGDANKIVKGTELDTEFTNIQTAGATKANSASPTFTGTVTAAAITVTGAATVIDGSFNITGSSDATKKLKFEVDTSVPTATTLTVVPGAGTILPAGLIFEYGGSSIPTGWLACDGTAVSRTTYAALFAAISTTWGPGDGATTFNVPDKRGRVAIGDGTGTVVEACTASSGNGFTVVSNPTKWLTGQPVILSNLTGFVTTATAGPTYYVVRISATNIRLATTLALAQNLTPDITISGSGTVTVTGTLTARTLGQNGGEEAHAQNINELISHLHNANTDNAATGGNPNYRTGSTNNSTVPGLAAGGNVAANVMLPFIVSKFIIST